MKHFSIKLFAVISFAMSLCSCGYNISDSNSLITNSIDSGTSASAGLLYTCKFYDDDKTTLLWTGTVSAGEDITYGGTTPSKAKTAQYTYTFSGWDKSLKGIKSNTDFYATYTSTVNTYRVEFINYDDTVIVSSEVEYDTYASAPTTDPIRAKTDEYTYTFKGWDKDPSTTKIVGPTTFKAQYDESKNTYLVSFVVEGVTTHTVAVAYGEYASYSNEWDAPVKSNDNDYVYSFKGWDKPLATTAITKDTTFTAVLSKVTNSFKVTFKDGDGNEVQSSSYKYGETPTYTGDEPTKTKDDQYTYAFADAWEPAISEVTSDATYTAKFTTVTNSYLVSFYDEDGTTLLYSKEFPYGTVPTYGGTKPSKASSNGKTYAFKGWDKDLVAVTGTASYKATYTATNIDYIITFKNGDTILESKTYHYGDTPSYTGTTPSKHPTAQYTYAFKSWDHSLASVTGNATYQATYNETLNQYLITFVDGNGKEIQSSKWDYGSTPTYTGTTPTKTGDVQYTYTFSSWPPIALVTGNATYTAEFTRQTNQYLITFVDGNGKEIQSSKWDYGSTPTYTGTTPTKTGDVQYTYTFSSWPTIASVTGDATYTAEFTSTINKYTISFYDEDGTTLLNSKEFAYGTTPVYEWSNPSKAKDQTYTYAFDGWDKTLVAVTGATSYKAKYTPAYIEYTITFKDDTNALLKTLTYHYGDTPSYGGTPTKEPTAEYKYTFSGWQSNFAKVTGNATYVANFSTSYREYTITYKNQDGSIIKTLQVSYGTVPTYYGDTPTQSNDAKYSYIFKEWDKSFDAVRGDTTYTALYYKGTVSLTYSYYQNTNGYYRYAVSGCSDSSITEVFILPNYKDSTHSYLPVTTILDGAFSSCTLLKSFNIPSCITTIIGNPFRGCSLTSINIDSGNTNFLFDNSVLFNADKTTLIYCIPTFSGTSGAYTVPSTVTAIANGAFKNCNQLTSLTLAFVGGSATGTNTYFGYLFGSPSNTSVDNYVPSSLKVVVITGTTDIYSHAFQGCSSLTSITIPEGVTTIGYAAFNRCSSLTSMTIPNSVTSIGSQAFYGCSSLTSLYVPFVGLSKSANDSFYEIFSSNFGDLPTTLTTVVVTGTTQTALNESAFYGCSYLKSITLPSSLKAINNYENGKTFYGCSALTEIKIAENTYFKTVDGVLFSKNGNILYCYPSSFKGPSNDGIYVVPSGVTTIIKNAFYGCSQLTSLSVPFVGKTNTYSESTSYLSYIFGAPTNTDTSTYMPSTLKEVIVQSGCTAINYRGFYDCSSLISIVLPSTMSTIGNYAFQGCSSLASIIIPSNVQTISFGAFYNCSSLTSIEIPSSVTSIASAAFQGCSSLTSITLPFVGSKISDTNYITRTFGYIFCPSDSSYSVYEDYVPSLLTTVIVTKQTAIPGDAFTYCSSLTSITLPDSVATIGNYAFSGCSSLLSINVANTNSTFKTVDGILFSKDEKTLYRYPAGKTGNYIVSSNITTIAPSAFEGYQGSQIDLPFIGTSATDTKYAYFNYIFDGLPYTYGYNVPSTLKTVVITGGTSLSYNAFNQCKYLVSITIPSSMTKISTQFFIGCTSLTSINVNSGNTGFSSIDGVLFKGTSLFAFPTNKTCTNNTYAIPETTTSIASSAFDGCSNMAAVVIPSKVVSIDSGAFNLCTSLASVTINSNVLSTINSYAFYGCSSLASFTIPNSVTTIGGSAFYGCSFTSINIPAKVSSIESSAFSKCASLTAFTIDNANTNFIVVDGVIFNSAKTSLICFPCGSNGNNGAYKIPDTVIKIGNDSFKYCTLLTSVVIPNSVTTIYSFAFEHCTTTTETGGLRIYCKASEKPTGWNDRWYYNVYDYVTGKYAVFTYYFGDTTH